MQEEIEDRYGNLPGSVTNLLNIALMKAEAKAIGIVSINQKGRNIVLTFLPDAPVDLDKLTIAISRNPAKLQFTMAPQPFITIKSFVEEGPVKDGGAGKIGEVRNLLGMIGG